MFDLSKLKSLVSQLQLEAAKVDRQRGEAYRPLFDEQLFLCRSKLLTPCVDEISHEISALEREQKAGKLQVARTAHMCEKIVAQVQAVQRELATQQVRQREPRRADNYRRPIHELYQDLAKHQDWERRLKATTQDKTLMLNHCQSLAEQQKLQQEITAFEGRIQRCKAAIAKIEKQITQQERQG
ncbi:prepilin peptidase [Photobacterium jeanii]|uniref:Prepilin peptidase n=1 Tax=Photobacterium jeanii TaxID=858640 RepID=A0A178KN54_9GAMM|nr:primosomal replication protein [Photobacterium jeanii]OAN18536.1 prepilin peptidase [Photobacterium jeanii]PST91782.1 prepilin peptidase [Photobacterium jeanii]